jgi:hypothetical protein
LNLDGLSGGARFGEDGQQKSSRLMQQRQQQVAPISLLTEKEYRVAVEQNA